VGGGSTAAQSQLKNENQRNYLILIDNTELYGTKKTPSAIWMLLPII